MEPASKKVKVSSNNNETTVEKSAEKLYLDESTADVFFAIDDENADGIVRVPGHKSRLAAVSSVFNELFYGDQKEDGDVEVSNVSADSFKVFLRFAYFDNVELKMENVVELLELGDLYNVVSCFDRSVDFLKENVTSDNVCSILTVALLYRKTELEMACANQIAADTEEVFKSKDFLDCDQSTLGYILRMNPLSVPETEIFDACMAWVAAKSEEDQVTKELVQEHLGELFYEIRFTSMEIEDFTKLYISHDWVFSDAEHEDIVEGFKRAPGCPKMFNGNPRKAEWNDEKVVTCNLVAEDTAEHLRWIKQPQCITFSTNKPLFLGAFTCGKIDRCEDPPSFVTIAEIDNLKFDKKSTKILSTFDGSFTLEKEVPLPEPILIRPGRFYRISVELLTVGITFSSKEIHDAVIIEPDTLINIHGIRKGSTSGQNFSLFTELKFNKIEATPVDQV